MTELESRCLDAFPEWLRSLADDAQALAVLLDGTALPEQSRRQIAGALNYLFKSLDLIPDGIEDLGFIDDAFVFRVATGRALSVDGASADADPSGALSRLAEDISLIQQFVGDDYPRLERFVVDLASVVARGRSVDDIVGDASVREAFIGDVKGWAGSYSAPTFARDEKNLVKLRSFLQAKLPA